MRRLDISLAILLGVLPFSVAARDLEPLGEFAAKPDAQIKCVTRCAGFANGTRDNPEAFSAFPSAESVAFRCNRDRSVYNAFLLEAVLDTVGLDWPTHVDDLSEKEFFVTSVMSGMSQISNICYGVYVSAAVSDEPAGTALAENDSTTCGAIPRP